VGGAGEGIVGVPLCSGILGTLWDGEIGGLFLLTGVTVSPGVSVGKEEVGLVLMTLGKSSTASLCVSTSSKMGTSSITMGCIVSDAGTVGSMDMIVCDGGNV